MKDGGPAFPNNPVAYHDPSGQTYLAETGMTLRDYFAAKAMQGLLAQSPSNWLSTHRSALEAEIKNKDEYIIPKMAYKFADAMIAERTKPQ